MKSSFVRLVLPLLLACIQSTAASGPMATAQQVETSARPKAERSTALTLTVNGVSLQLTHGDLAKLPQSSLTVHNSHTNRDERYTGVTLSALLQKAGVVFSKETQSTYLRSYIRAQGTDFYFVIYSAAETEPQLSTAAVLVATQMDGHDLGADGEFKLVGSADKRPARWVRNLSSLTLTTLN